MLRIWFLESMIQLTNYFYAIKIKWMSKYIYKHTFMKKGIKKIANFSQKLFAWTIFSIPLCVQCTCIYNWIILVLFLLGLFSKKKTGSFFLNFKLHDLKLFL